VRDTKTREDRQGGNAAHQQRPAACQILQIEIELKSKQTQKPCSRSTTMALPSSSSSGQRTRPVDLGPKRSAALLKAQDSDKIRTSRASGHPRVKPGKWQRLPHGCLSSEADHLDYGDENVFTIISPRVSLFSLPPRSIQLRTFAQVRKHLTDVRTRSIGFLLETVALHAVATVDVPLVRYRFPLIHTLSNSAGHRAA
jgi:hypothetical protein